MALGSVEQLRVVGEWRESKPSEDPYHRYAAAGGTLDEELFRAATQCASTFDIENLDPHTKDQAKHMSGYTAIPLRDTLVVFYGILREKSFPVPAGKEKLFIDCTISDQGTFAQALLLDKQPEAYRRFISEYPNIFPQTHDIHH